MAEMTGHNNGHNNLSRARLNETEACMRTLKTVGQIRLGGGSFKIKELFCSISSHKYIVEVRPIKIIKLTFCTPIYIYIYIYKLQYFSKKCNE